MVFRPPRAVSLEAEANSSTVPLATGPDDLQGTDWTTRIRPLQPQAAQRQRSAEGWCSTSCCHVYGTIRRGTGGWRPRPTATEPATRWIAEDELPTTITTNPSRL